jgi:hypothetical protein
MDMPLRWTRVQIRLVYLDNRSEVVNEECFPYDRLRFPAVGRTNDVGERSIGLERLHVGPTQAAAAADQRGRQASAAEAGNQEPGRFGPDYNGIDLEEVGQLSWQSIRSIRRHWPRNAVAALG